MPDRGLPVEPSDTAIAHADSILHRQDWEDVRDALRAAYAVEASPALSLQDGDAAILGDETHPDTRDYVATNLLAALSLVPDTGDWHGQLRQWCQRNSTGKLEPLPSKPALSLTREEAEVLEWACRMVQPLNFDRAKLQAFLQATEGQG